MHQDGGTTRYRLLSFEAGMWICLDKDARLAVQAICNSKGFESVESLICISFQGGGNIDVTAILSQG